MAKTKASPVCGVCKRTSSHMHGCLNCEQPIDCIGEGPDNVCSLCKWPCCSQKCLDYHRGKHEDDGYTNADDNW